VITINNQERTYRANISVSLKKEYEKYAADSLQAGIVNIDEKEDAQLFLNKDSVFVSGDLGYGWFYVSDFEYRGDFHRFKQSGLEVTSSGN
jgi:hypothetical protein